ncbi:MAG: helix-turn-helix domain-containing protein [Pseudomonadales bacterium]
MNTLLDEIRSQLDAFLRPEQDLRQARKRQRILAAATDRFIAHGYRKTSIDDIARAAGVAKGTVYLYYRSKPELLFHAMALEQRGYLDRLAPLGERGLSPLERLRRFIALAVIVSRDMPLVTRLTGGDHELALAIEEVDAEVLEGISRVEISLTVDLIDAATNRTWPAEELERRARVLIDTVYAVVTAGGVLRPALPLEESAHLLAATLTSGVLHVRPEESQLRQASHP